MLSHRILSAIVGIPVAVVLVCKGGLWLTLPVIILSLIGLHEFAGKARSKGVHVLELPGALVAVGFI